VSESEHSDFHVEQESEESEEEEDPASSESDVPLTSKTKKVLKRTANGNRTVSKKETVTKASSGSVKGKSGAAAVVEKKTTQVSSLVPTVIRNKRDPENLKDEVAAVSRIQSQVTYSMLTGSRFLESAPPSDAKS
jgi:hypothetical protein